MSVVEIPVLGHVAPTQLVLLLNMPQCVTVRWDTPVIHSQDAHKFSKLLLQLKGLETLAIHHHVVPMQYAKSVMVLALVYACRNILETHILVVGQNVLLIPTVIAAKHV
jgi:hypothetical protein